MKLQQDIEYLKNMTEINTPKRSGQYLETYDNICKIYCNIRNTAKDALDKLIPIKKAKTTLKELLEKTVELQNA